MLHNAQHLIFYDGTCGLCHEIVQFLLKRDRKKRFLFAPLQGNTAKKILPIEMTSQLDSLVLVENYGSGSDQHLYFYGKGAFRILWLLGSWWCLLGIFCFFPSQLYNWGYRFIAKNRFKWFNKQNCMIPSSQEKDRFLN